MRSPNEHAQDSEAQTPKELQLLSELEDAPDITQRELSRRLGIALGLTNMLVRNLTHKGYLRVVQASWKHRLYTLTPEGFTQKIRLMASYISRFLDDYRSVRQTLRDQLDPLALNAESRVAIYGTGEFAELVYLGLREIGIEEIDVFEASGPNNAKFLGLPVRDISGLRPDHYDRVLIAHLAGQETTRTQLRELGIKEESLITFFDYGRKTGEWP